MKINFLFSSAVNRVLCGLALTWIAVANAYAVADEWINFGDNSKHTFTREGTTWGLLIPNNGGPAQGSHASAAVRPNTANAWNFNNATAAILAIVLDGKTNTVLPGTSHLVVGTNFTFALDYGTGSPHAQDVLTVTSRDNAAGLDLNQYTFYFGDSTPGGGTPHVTVTLLATVAGQPVELTAGHLWPFSLSHLTGSVMAMGTTMMPMSVPTLNFWGMLALAICLLGLGAGTLHRRTAAGGFAA